MNVHGVDIMGYGAQQVAEDLQSYCSHIPAAREHLEHAATVGATVAVQNTGHVCRANKTKVEISRDMCLDSHTGLTSMLYLVESIFFELQNVINYRGYDQLRVNVKKGTISILQYGLGMAKLEFESTEKVVKILAHTKEAGRKISPWGLKQMREYPKGLNNFVNAPHDPNGPAEQKLPSKLFYAYEFLDSKIGDVKNMGLPVLKKLATVRSGNKIMQYGSLGRLVANDWARTYGAKRATGFLVCYIDALLWLSNEVQWTVQWGGGTKQEWKLCSEEFVRAVPTLQHDRAATEAIKKDIMNNT